eukprot:gene1630-2273_t
MELVRGQVGERALRALESDLAQSLLGFRIKMRFASYQASTRHVRATQEEFWGTVVQKRLQINRGPPRLLFLVVYDDEDYEELDIKSLSEVLVPCSEAQHAAYNALISVARRSSLKVTGKSATLSVVEAQRELFDVEEHGEPPQIADAVREDRAAPDRQDHRTGVSRELPSTVSIPVPGGHLEAIPQTSTPARGAHSAGGSAEAELLAKCDGEVQAEGGSTEVMRLEECDGEVRGKGVSTEVMRLAKCDEEVRAEGGSTEVMRLEECDGEVRGKGGSTEVMRLEECDGEVRGKGVSTEVMRLEECDGEVRGKGGSTEVMRLEECDGEVRGKGGSTEVMRLAKCDEEVRAEGGSTEVMRLEECDGEVRAEGGSTEVMRMEECDGEVRAEGGSTEVMRLEECDGEVRGKGGSTEVMRLEECDGEVRAEGGSTEVMRLEECDGEVRAEGGSIEAALDGEASGPITVAEQMPQHRGQRSGPFKQGSLMQAVFCALVLASPAGLPTRTLLERIDWPDISLNHLYAALFNGRKYFQRTSQGVYGLRQAPAPSPINCSVHPAEGPRSGADVGRVESPPESPRPGLAGASCDMPEDGWDKGSLFVVMQKGKEDAVPEVPEGWEREVVQRQSGASAQSGVRCDTYYRAPCGKRLRSLPEIQEHHVKHEKQCFRTAAGGRILFEQFRYTNRKESVSLQGCTHRAALPWAKETNWSKRQLEAPSAAPDTTKQRKLEAPSAAPDTTKQRKLE